MPQLLPAFPFAVAPSEYISALLLLLAQRLPSAHVPTWVIAQPSDPHLWLRSLSTCPPVIRQAEPKDPISSLGSPWRPRNDAVGQGKISCLPEPPAWPIRTERGPCWPRVSHQHGAQGAPSACPQIYQKLCFGVRLRAVWYGGTQHSSSHPKYKIYLLSLPKCMKSFFFFFPLWWTNPSLCLPARGTTRCQREGHPVTSVISYTVSWLSKTYLALIEINLTGISRELGADTVLCTYWAAEPTAGSQHTCAPQAVKRKEQERPH